MKSAPALNQREASRAVYLDSEGTMTDPATLLGILRADEEEQEFASMDFRQVVLEPAFEPAARGAAFGTGPGSYCNVGKLEDVLEQVLTSAEDENRAIVAWSVREMDVVEESASQRVVERFMGRYVNAGGT